MLTQIAASLGTVAAAVILAAILAAAAFSVIRDKKKGKSSCGCGCSHCAMAGSCHKGK